MVLEQLGILADIVAAVAVVVSLYYVAIQLRKNTNAIRSAAFQGHADSVHAFVELLSRPEMRNIFVKGRSDYDALSEEEAVGFHALMISLFGTIENVFFQRGQSALEHDYWAARKSVIDRYIAYKGVRDWWRKHQSTYTGAFQDEINTRIKDAPNKAQR